MIRRFAAFAISAALIMTALAMPAPAAAEASPQSMAATGDSITRAFNLCFFPFTDCPAQSWSTGTSSTVKSHAYRLGITSRAYNDAVSGAKMADLPGQVNTVFSRNVDYVTVLMGGNDVCTDTEGGMTSPGAYESDFRLAMEKLKTDTTPPLVYVVSVPNVKMLWEILKDNSTARSRWNSYNICQSLLSNPLSVDQADVDRRERVKQRNMELNQRLRTACGAYTFCRFDGEAAFGTPFVPNDVSTRDYFHPSTAGQTKLASVSYDHGYWGTKGVNGAPTASFTSSCSGLTCTFTDTSTDPNGLSGRSWNFDASRAGGATSVAPTVTHTFAGEGPYTVKLYSIDGLGATASTSVSLTFSDSSEPTNSPPIASFTSSCTDLTCTFTDGSTDSDGSISSRSWDFGDGNVSTATNPSHTYQAGGTYTVTLTVTDDDGATASKSQSVTVAAPSTAISLSVSGSKVKGTKIADLTWSGATATNVDVYRDNVKVATTANDGAHTDSPGKGGGTHTYQICEAGTDTCSNEVSVSY